jgi:flavin-dependent dehydrogenase
MTAPLILGAGPAGCAAAIALAGAGIRPRVLERHRETADAVCGGFLSWRTLDTLASLGIEAPEGHRVSTLRLFAGTRIAEASLPGRAIGLSRQALDTRLQHRAVELGAGIERGVSARGWENGRLFLADGAQLTPGAFFLATGKHDLRGFGRPRDSHQTVGIRVRLAAGPALDRLAAGAIELHLFRDGYCGLVLQEGGMGNLCLAVRKDRLAEAGGNPVTLLQQWSDDSAHFAERAALVVSEPDAIGAVPYGWMARDTVPGAYRLGDQAAVIPSLAGEGIGIALASGIAAAAALQSGESAPIFQPRFRAAARRPVMLAQILWRLCEHPMAAERLTRLAALAPWLAGRIAGQTRIAH